MVEMRDERGAVLEILLEIVESQFIDGVIIKTRGSANNKKGVRYMQVVTVKEIEKRRSRIGAGSDNHSQGNIKKEVAKGEKNRIKLNIVKIETRISVRGI